MIGGFVWYDENYDGLQDEHERGITDIVLTLHGMRQALDSTVENDGQIAAMDVMGGTDGNIELIATAVTDRNGYYQFSQLNTGSYDLVIEVPPSYIMSPADIGTDDGVDSDIEPTLGRSTVQVLDSSQPIHDVDIGLRKALYTRSSPQETERIFLPLIIR